MKERVKPSFHRRQEYYDKGIGIEDDRWLDFSAFLADMGTRPPETHLDRLDVSKGYCRLNCRWATRQEQQSTRSNSVTEDMRHDILCMRNDGFLLREIAEKHQRSVPTIHRICKTYCL